MTNALTDSIKQAAFADIWFAYDGHGNTRTQSLPSSLIRKMSCKFVLKIVHLSFNCSSNQNDKAAKNEINFFFLVCISCSIDNLFKRNK